MCSQVNTHRWVVLHAYSAPLILHAYHTGLNGCSPRKTGGLVYQQIFHVTGDGARPRERCGIRRSVISNGRGRFLFVFWRGSVRGHCIDRIRFGTCADRCVLACLWVVGWLIDVCTPVAPVGSVWQWDPQDSTSSTTASR